MNTTRDLSVEAARGLMLSQIEALGSESIGMDRFALGRVLAEPILAMRSQPPFDASAMDGWAVRLADAPPHPAGYLIVGESAAGRGYAHEVAAGEAIRIFTGAPVPEGCAVVMQEHAERRDDRLRLTGPAPAARTHVRPRGGDFRAGDTLLTSGMRLDALRLSLAASAGRAAALAARRPRVGILSTGEEIVRPGADAPGAAQIFESTSPALAALVASWGGEPSSFEPAVDEVQAISSVVASMDVDLIVTIGGASVGDYDLVKPAMRSLGLEMMVETVKLRPGKPTWFGVLADGRKVLGLPGNPASALVCAELFLRPLLLAWQGADPALALVWAQLCAPSAPTGPREHWMRANLTADRDGVQRVTPFADQDSSLVSVFAQANALLRRPAGADGAPVGTLVQVLRLERL